MGARNQEFEKSDFIIINLIMMIYLMSKMWGVFAQSSEPKAHVKNA